MDYGVSGMGCRGLGIGDWGFGYGISGMGYGVWGIGYGGATALGWVRAGNPPRTYLQGGESLRLLRDGPLKLRAGCVKAAHGQAAQCTW